jgi:hypothetical protein
MVATGNLPKGTRVGPLMRQLLGREPGTVPGQATRQREMTAAESIQALLALGATDRRPEAARG